MKRCPGCFTFKPREEFYSNKSCGDGVSVRCKLCTRLQQYGTPELRAKRDARHAAWWSANREKQSALRTAKRLAARDAFNEVNRKYKASNRSLLAAAGRDYYARNKAAGKANARKWRIAHPEEVRERQRMRRLRKRGLYPPRINAEKIKARAQFFGDRCWLCGGAYQTMDHVKPLKVGGPHLPANMRPACFSCNSRKRDLWPMSAVRERFQLQAR